MRKFFIAALAATLLCAPVAADEEGWLTRSGYYRLSFESELEPIVINTMHAWVFYVTSPEGVPVTGALLTASGGMPEHNHGLPTQPRMIAELGNGRYRFEGFRFHMNGAWELTVTVDVDGRRDTVVIPLTI